MALGNRYDYPRHRGDAYNLTFTLVNPDGTPVDLTAAGTTDLRYNFALLDPASPFPAPLGAALLVPEKAIGTGITVVGDATLGQVSVAIIENDTNGLDPGKLYYEVQYTDPASNPATPLYGVKTLREDLLT